MSRDTKIQWCDSTVNPVMGCDGCELWSGSRRTCYAGVLHGRYGKNPGYADSFDVPEEFPGRMADAAKWKALGRFSERPAKPWLNGMPRLIFVSDMGDALSKSVGFEYLEREVVQVAASVQGARHRWLWLTKRPRRMLEFAEWLAPRRAWPMNLWPMTSVTGRGTMRRAMILPQIGPTGLVRGISFEPLVDEPDWHACLAPLHEGPSEDPVVRPVAWAIFGGESGHGAREFDAGILRRGIEACREFGVAPFVKQMGARPVGLSVEGRLRDGHGGEWSEWAEDLRVREMPNPW